MNKTQIIPKHLETIESNRHLSVIKDFVVTQNNHKEAKSLRADANKALEKSNRARLNLKKLIDEDYQVQMGPTIEVINNFDSQIKNVEKEIIESKLKKIDSYLQPEGINRDDYPKSWFNLGKSEADIINELPEFISQFEYRVEEEVKEVIEPIKLTKMYNIQGTKEQHIKLKLFLQKEDIKWD